MADRLEIFTGFDIAYPVYEIITPQTLNKYSLRTMEVSDEEKLKGSFINTKSIPSHINKTIWSVMKDKPACIKTYDDFLTHTTTSDRDALLYGLYHITYKEIQDYEVVCECEKSYPIKVNVEDSFNINPYTGCDVVDDKGISTFKKAKPNDILKKRIYVELDIAKGVIAVIKAPTLYDENVLTTDALFENEETLKIGTDMIFIEKFIQTDAEGHTNEIIERDNILIGYKSLPSLDKKKIQKQYEENFGKYNIEISVKSTCPHCQKINKDNIDLMRNFFRTLFQ